MRCKKAKNQKKNKNEWNFLTDNSKLVLSDPQVPAHVHVYHRVPLSCFILFLLLSCIDGIRSPNTRPVWLVAEFVTKISLFILICLSLCVVALVRFTFVRLLFAAGKLTGDYEDTIQRFVAALDTAITASQWWISTRTNRMF